MRYIVGIGSHSEVIYSILADGQQSVAFVSYPSKIDVESTSKTVRENYHGGLDNLKIEKEDSFIIGLGDNLLRKQIAEKYPGLRYLNAIHPKATLVGQVTVGIGNVICAGVVIQTGTIVGDHNIINTNSSLDHHTKIADFCHVAPNSAICGNVTLYQGVFLGVGSSVVPGVKIKPWQFIKANSLVKDSSGPIPMYEPLLDKYKQSALDAIESGWISSLGKFISLASEKLKETIGAKHVILTNNGTSATHALFLALKQFHPETKKIYVPNNVYVAAWNCALMEYSVDQLEVLPVDPLTWNTPTSEIFIKSLDKGSAVMIVHNLGNIVDIPRLKKIRSDLIFIEDNCEGLFGKYSNGKYSGASDEVFCSSVSFYGNKNITTGEGGAVLTSDKKVYDFLLKTCNQGMSSQKYIHDTFGYNYRMTNIQAAFLYDQLCDLSRILGIKESIFSRYQQLLQPLETKGLIKCQLVEPGTTRANWIFALRIVGIPFHQVRDYLLQHGVDSRPMFYPIETHQHLKDLFGEKTKFSQKTSKVEKDNPNSPGTVWTDNQEIIMLPSSPNLKPFEQSYIIELIEKFIKAKASKAKT